MKSKLLNWQVVFTSITDAVLYLSHARNHSENTWHGSHLCNCTSLLQEVIEVKFCTHYFLLYIFSILLAHLSKCQLEAIRIYLAMKSALNLRHSQLLVLFPQTIEHLPFPICALPYDQGKMAQDPPFVLLVLQAWLAFLIPVMANR